MKKKSTKKTSIPIQSNSYTNFKKTFKIHELTNLCYTEAKNKGFHRKSENPDLSKYLMNLHGEISELWEAYRGGLLDQPCNKSKIMKKNKIKPLTCFEEEIADIFIRTCDMAEAFKINLTEAVFYKMMFNRTRPHRNGGKLA